MKFALDLLLVALIPLGAVAWLTASAGRVELERSAKQNLQLLASVTAARIDQLLLDTTRSVQQAARDDAVMALCLREPSPQPDGPDNETGVPASDAKTQATAAEESAESVSTTVPADPLVAATMRRLHAITATNADFASAFVADRRGVGLASTNARNVGQDLTFRSYVTSALAGRTGSELLVGRTTSEPGVYFSAPVHAEPGNPGSAVVGAVVIKLKASSIWTIVDAPRLGEHGYALLVDDHGILIGHPQRDRLYHSLEPLRADVEAAIDPKTRFGLDRIDSLRAEGLMVPLTDPTLAGEANFTLASSDSGDGGTAWVAGYQRMNAKPWKVAMVEPLAQLHHSTSTIVGRALGLAAGVSLIVLALAIWRARSLVRPIVELSRAAGTLAAGDFSARAQQLSRDEVGQLARTFNEMVPKLRENVELQRSLALATGVQQALLPDHPPTLPGLDVFGKSRYCDSTGGDYYDFVDLVDLPDRRGALLAVGDVTGHGIGAALLMCTARAALRTAAMYPGADLGQMLTRVNALLSQEQEHGLFMTLTILLIDPPAGTVRYACAGHDPIYVLPPGSAEWRELGEGFLALGAMPDSVYEEYRADGIAPGSLLFIGTDGIWEARNASDAMYGKEPMLASLVANRDLPAKEIGLAMERGLDAFLGERKAQDDVTYVVIKVD